MGFSGGSDDKESACSGGDPGSFPGCTIPVTHKQWLSKVISKFNTTCLPPSHNCLHTRTARLNLECDFYLSSEIVLFPSVKKRKIDPRCSHGSTQSFKRAHRLSQNQQDDCKMSLPECAKYAPMWTRKDMGDHWIHKTSEDCGSLSCPVGSGADTGCFKPCLTPTTTLDGRDYYYYLFHRGENWGSERLSHLPNVTQWVRNQAGNWVHAVWHQVCEE